MKRILVCEDEDAIRDFVVINLKRSGYDVIDVSNAAQAMDAYVHYGGLIDVALLDIMMPGMDGSELCRWLRQKSDTMGIITSLRKKPGGRQDTLSYAGCGRLCDKAVLAVRACCKGRCGIPQGKPQHCKTS